MLKFVCSRVDPSLCLANLPRLFSVCTQLWLSEQPEVRGGATHCMESVAQAAFGPVPVSTTVYESALQKVVVHVSAGLSYQYHSAWAQVIHVMGTLFEVFLFHNKLILFIVVIYLHKKEQSDMLKYIPFL